MTAELLQPGADHQGEIGQANRHHHRQPHDAHVIAQQRGRLHRRHAGIMHRADARAHQERGDEEQLLRRPVLAAEHEQRHAAGQHPRQDGDEREHKTVVDPARQGKGQHADEMHRPDAAAHHDGADGGPDQARRPGRSGDNAVGHRQSHIHRQHRDTDRQGHERKVVGALVRRYVEQLQKPESTGVIADHGIMLR